MPATGERREYRILKTDLLIVDTVRKVSSKIRCRPLRAFISDSFDRLFLPWNRRKWWKTHRCRCTGIRETRRAAHCFRHSYRFRRHVLFWRDGGEVTWLRVWKRFATFAWNTRSTNDDLECRWLLLTHVQVRFSNLPLKDQVRFVLQRFFFTAALLWSE